MVRGTETSCCASPVLRLDEAPPPPWSSGLRLGTRATLQSGLGQRKPLSCGRCSGVTPDW